MFKYNTSIKHATLLPQTDHDAGEELHLNGAAIVNKLWPDAGQATITNNENTYILNDEGTLEQRSFDKNNDLAKYARSGRLFMRDHDNKLRQINVNYSEGEYSAEVSKPAQYLEAKRPSGWKRFWNAIFGAYHAEVEAYKRAKILNDAYRQLAENSNIAIDPIETEMQLGAYPEELVSDVAVQNEVQQVQNPEPIRRGLEPIDNDALAAAEERLNYPAGKVFKPKNLDIDEKKFGMLVAMIQGSPDLEFSYRVKDKENPQNKTEPVHVVNDPDANYKSIINARFISGGGMTKMQQLFIKHGESQVTKALENADNGNYTDLAKILAHGLIQNNKVLQEQRKINDTFTAYADLGYMALLLIESRAALKDEVMKVLGDDAKQLKIAAAAKNISDLRRDVMPEYKNMVDTYGKLTYTTQNFKGMEISVPKLAFTGSRKSVTRVALLSQIEVNMNFGQLNLEDFAQKKVLRHCIATLSKAPGIRAFLSDRNRCEKLQNPVTMKKLCDRANREIAQLKEQKKWNNRKMDDVIMEIDEDFSEADEAIREEDKAVLNKSMDAKQLIP